MAKLSIMGLLTADNTIFDGMSIPSGLDKTTVLDTITEECYGLEILHPDPNYMKHAIRAWSARRLWSWTKLYETMNFEYNPIWNKDGTVTETETGTNDSTVTRGGSVTTAGTVDTDGTVGTSGTNTHAVRGYNSSALTTSESDTVNSTDTTDMTNTTDMTVTNDLTDVTDAEHSITRTRQESGNIGVTTTQQMIREEREVSNFDIYLFIAEEFKAQFCVMVY